jgi:hypothetical protein
MKRVIDGKTYNTDTATTVARWNYVDHDGYDTEATLFQTKGGAFFAVHVWEVTVSDAIGCRETKLKTYVEVLSRDDVEKRKTTEDFEVLNEEALGELPPEAAEEEEKGATIFVRVPEALKAVAEAAARKADLSLNSWVMRCIENCSRASI